MFPALEVSTILICFESLKSMKFAAKAKSAVTVTLAFASLSTIKGSLNAKDYEVSVIWTDIESAILVLK